MASNNFKLFDENKKNMQTDIEYNADSQRLQGVQSGVASSKLNNKFAYQVSLVAYAIAQLMNANGVNANDTDAVSTFVNNLSASVVQKVVDKATTSQAQVGTDNTKWVTPAHIKAAIQYYTNGSGSNVVNVRHGGTGLTNVPYNQFLVGTGSTSLKSWDGATLASYLGIEDINNRINAVGNVVISADKDFIAKNGEQWHLCDGSILESVDYSEFAKATVSPFASYGVNITARSGYSVRCSFGDEDTILVLQVADSGGYTYIVKSDDGGENWSETFYSSMDSPESLYGYEGVWCIGKDNDGFILCSTDNAVTWVSAYFSSFSVRALSIYCYEGLWCLCFYAGTDSSYVAYSKTPSVSGSWASVKLNFYGTSVNTVYCYEGMWVALCGSSTYFISTDNCITWEKKIIDSDNDSLYLAGVYCYEGTWGILASDSEAFYVYYGGDIANPSVFNKNIIANTYGSSALSLKKQLICVNGIWCFMVQFTNAGSICGMYYSYDLSSGFNMFKMNPYLLPQSSQFMFDDNGFLNSYLSSNSSSYTVESFTNSKIELPNLSGDKVKYYIKLE